MRQKRRDEDGAVKRIGIDFDNTIAGYDHVFLIEAQRSGLVPNDFSGGKVAIREHVHASGRGDEAWMALQGRVYGALMPAAELLPGAADFFARCRALEIELFIVSHKTQTGHFDPTGIPLRDVALDWMRAHGFFDPAGFALNEANVSFHSTRDEKVERIAELRPDAFIDDLEAVLTHPAFPGATRTVRYDALDSARDWPAIARRLLGPRNSAALAPDELARLLSPAPVFSVAKHDGGGNNQIYLVETDSGPFCLKTSLASASDPRNRYRTEHAALSFLQSVGGRSTPRLHAAHEPSRALLIEWIDGASIREPSDADLQDAVRFVRRLQSFAQLDSAAALPLASEACLSASELIGQIEARLTRLAAVACIDDDLESLLTTTLRPAFERARARVEADYSASGWELRDELAAAKRTLSPSDFGFHNAVRRRRGGLVFLDFEYFGWDDPVKLVADFLLHPAMTLTREQRRTFLDAMSELFAPDACFDARLCTLFPLYALRWACILLNPFLPERRARLAFADARLGEAALRTQLTRARAWIDRSLEARPEALR